MDAPYLLLTPVFALAILALARFVGCDLVFPLGGRLSAHATATPAAIVVLVVAERLGGR